MNFAVEIESLGADIRAAADAARALGFTGIVARAQSRSVDFSQLSQSGTREVLHIFSARGLKLVAIQHDLPPTGLRAPVDIDREIARFDASLAAAAALDRAMVLCDLATLPPAPAEGVAKAAISPDLAGPIIIPEFSSPVAPSPELSRAEPRDLPFESTVSSALHEIAVRADRYGVIVAFRSSLAALASLRRALDAASCPWFGVDLDPIAMLADEWPADEVFSRLGAHIRHVRGRDGIRGGGNRVRPTEIGKGSVDWPVMLANLDAAGFGGFILIDTSDIADRAAAAALGLAALSRYSGKGTT